MPKRKWITRTLVGLVVLLVGGAAYLYWQWTDPKVVREAVLAELRERLPGADVQLGSARVRLFGGITLTDLAIRRAGEPDATPLGHFPSSVLYHDKSELSRGRLTIRKVELSRPQIAVIRGRDGRWNFSGLTGPAKPAKPAAVPIVEIRQASLSFVDQTKDWSPLTLEDADGTLTPDGDDRIRMQLGGQLKGIGRVEVRGVANTKSGELSLAVTLPDVRVDQALLDRLAEYEPELRAQKLSLRGQASVHADIVRNPEATDPWSVSAKLHVRDLQVMHPDLPMTLEHGEVIAHLEGSRVRVEKLEGRANGALVQASGQLFGLSQHADFEFKVRIQRLHVEPALYPRLATPLQKLCANFSPDGFLSVDTRFERKTGQLTSHHVVRLQGMRITYEDFPYPVEHGQGVLEYTDRPMGGPIMTLDLAGQANGQPVRVVGEVYGEGLRPGNDYRTGLSIEIDAQNIPIDEALFGALKPQSQKIARQFRPTGLIDIAVSIRRPAGTAEQPKPTTETHILANVHHATICYEKFPYPVEEASGRLEIRLPGEQWRVHGFVGRHKGGFFQCNASSVLSPEGERIVAYVRGTNVLLDVEMRQALPAKVVRTWDRFDPYGRADFLARVDVLSKNEPDVDLTLTARGCRVMPAFFPYEITELVGTLRYVQDRVTLGEFAGRHGGSRIFLGRNGYGGSVAIRSKGGFRAELLHLRGEPIEVDADLLAALPSKLRNVAGTLRPDQPLRVALDLTIDREADGAPELYVWDGQATFANCNFHAGVEVTAATGVVALHGSFDGRKLLAQGNLHLQEAKIFHLPLKDVVTELQMNDHLLVMPGVQAKLHGGRVYGPIRAELGDTVQYRLDLTVSNVDLEEFARQTLGRTGAVNGRAFGRILLIGAGKGVDNLRGSGSIDVAGGKLYDLPIIVNLLSIVGGSLPKGTAFQEAYIRFTVEEGKLHFSQFDLLGDALSLKGKGSMRVGGSDIDLQMYAMLWGRAMPLLPPLVNRIPPAISRNLMKVHVTGSLENVNVDKEPVPILTESLRQLFQMDDGRRGEMGELP